MLQLCKPRKINHPWFLTVLLPLILNRINWWLTLDWVFWSPQTLQMVLSNLKFRYVLCIVVLNLVCASMPQKHAGFIFVKVLWWYYWSHYLCFLWHLLNNLVAKLDTLFTWYYLMFNARSWAISFPPECSAWKWPKTYQKLSEDLSSVLDFRKILYNSQNNMSEDFTSVLNLGKIV